MVGSLELTAAHQSALAEAAVAASEMLPRFDVNPRVGCAILDVNGEVCAVSAHAGAGTAHAEVSALAIAGDRSRGGTAIVTLQPCDHVGLTGSCTDALISAGIAHVIYASDDPTGHSVTTDAKLQAAGVTVLGNVDEALAQRVLGTWLFLQKNKRPYVTWKVAASLDGYIADTHGTSKWITSESSRNDVQALRARVGAIITSTRTVLADDPSLTVRNHDVQPLRVIVGQTPIPSDFRIFTPPGRAVHEQTHDIERVLGSLGAQGIHHVLLEAGGRLGAAFVENSLIDEIHWFTAGILLGSGIPAFAATQPIGLGDATRWTLEQVSTHDSDIRSVWRATTTAMRMA